MVTKAKQISTFGMGNFELPSDTGLGVASCIEFLLQAEILVDEPGTTVITTNLPPDAISNMDTTPLPTAIVDNVTQSENKEPTTPPIDDSSFDGERSCFPFSLFVPVYKDSYCNIVNFNIQHLTIALESLIGN